VRAVKISRHFQITLTRIRHQKYKAPAPTENFNYHSQIYTKQLFGEISPVEPALPAEHHSGAGSKATTESHQRDRASQVSLQQNKTSLRRTQPLRPQHFLILYSKKSAFSLHLCPRQP
jgi:hypothetical protein